MGITLRNRAGDVPTADRHRPLVSVVVPCFNEADVLPLFVERAACLIKEAADDFRVEVVLVDDGSTDDTWPLICRAAARDGRFRGVKLSRNFGQQAALTCGYEFAAGDAVVSLDADLQDPPELVPEMVARWQGGADVVLTVRSTRAGETRAKLWTARAFYWLLARVCGGAARSESGDFRLLSRRAVAALLSLREQHRYVRGMVQWLGFKVAEVRYDRPARAAGRTKYTYRAMAALAAEAFVTSGRRPLDLAATAAGAVAAAGLAAGAGLLAGWGLGLPAAAVAAAGAGLSLVVAAAGTLLAVVAVGYVGRTFEQVRRRPLYLVEEVVGGPPVRGAGRGDAAGNGWLPEPDPAGAGAALAAGWGGGP